MASKTAWILDTHAKVVMTSQSSSGGWEIHTLIHYGENTGWKSELRLGSLGLYQLHTGHSASTSHVGGVEAELFWFLATESESKIGSGIPYSSLGQCST